MKGLMIFFVCMVTSLSTLAAEKSVITEGTASTKEKATQMALQEAVDVASGVVLMSETWVKKDELVKDDIAMASFGFISTYQVLEYKKQPDGNHYVKLEARIIATPKPVSSSPGKPESISAKEWAGLENAQKTLRSQIEVIKTKFGDERSVLRNAYRFEYGGFNVTEPTPDGLKGYYVVNLTINGQFWKGYKNFIQKIAKNSVGEDQYLTGILGGINHDKSRFFSVHHRYAIQGIFKEHDTMPFTVDLSLPGASRKLLMIKNGVIMTSPRMTLNKTGWANERIHPFELIEIQTGDVSGIRYDPDKEILTYSLPQLSLNTSQQYYDLYTRLDKKPRKIYGERWNEFTFEDLFNYFDLKSIDTEVFVGISFDNVEWRKDPNRFLIGLVGDENANSLIQLKIPFNVRSQNELIQADTKFKVSFGKVMNF